MEVSSKTQRESRKDTRKIHSPRESDVIAKDDTVVEPGHTQSAPTNDDYGQEAMIHDMFVNECFTICLFISPDLDGFHDMFVHREPQMRHYR